MNETRQDDDRLREVFGGSPDSGSPTSECPGHEAIWKAAQGELEPDAAAAVVDHVAACAACAESWRMARAIADEAGVERTAKVLPFHRRPVVRVLGAVAAFLLIGVFVVPPLLDRGTTSPGDEFRVPETVELKSLIDESVALPRSESLLRWTGGPEGSLYTVEIADENLEILHRSAPIEASEYLVPADALAGLSPGAMTYWRIEAVLPDSTRVDSATFLLRVQ